MTGPDDVIVISPPGALHVIFHDGFRKSDRGLMMVIYGNCLSAMHGFRDNKLLCQTDMTPSSVLHHGALHALFHDGF